MYKQNLFLKNWLYRKAFPFYGICSAGSLSFYLCLALIVERECACTNGAHQANLVPRKTSNVLCANAQKITSIYPDHVYSLSGYSNEAGNAYNLFDENAFVDPRSSNGVQPGYIPQTSPQPRDHPAIYFPAKKGNRIAVDMLMSYQLTELYVYDRSQAEDSVWIYTGDMTHWKLSVAFVSRSGPGSWGWRRFPISDSSRFFMVRFASYETCLTEMVLYGCPYGKTPSAPSPIGQAPGFTRKEMKDFLGVNLVNETNTEWLKPFHYCRFYDFALDFDNDSILRTSPIRFNMLHYGYWNVQAKKYQFDADAIKSVNHAVVWYSIRGVSMWQSRNGLTDKDRPVDLPGMDPENPMSYRRHSAMMWHLAAFFGNASVDTNLLSLTHSPRRSGLGVMSVFENGNEEDANWVGDKYCSPLAYFAQSSADFDGHQGQLGPGHGILDADPASQLMTSGMIELDTNRVRTYKFLCNSLRTDSVFIWKGGIQYHHYSTDGKKGITPEEDSLRWRLARVREATFRIEPQVPCFLGENGYDKNPHSRQGAPLLPGRTQGENQAIFLLRSINATAFSGFDAYILFWLRDYGPMSDPNPYATCGILGPADKGQTRAYPAWFFISTFENQLENYVPDSIIRETGSVWLYKYRHALQRDSVAYFVYCPTRNGARNQHFLLSTGDSLSQLARVVSFKDNSTWGEQQLSPARKGSVFVDVDECPKLVFLSERH